MTKHKTGTREEWLAARLGLLKEEKELTRRDVTPVPEPVAQLAVTVGTDAPTYSRDRPGMSAFVLEDGVICHTYSTYSRGVDAIWGMYQLLDRSPKGLNETGIWWLRHDVYDKH